ncbi:unnamed protein product [Calypogeia fissa]
MDIAQMQRIAQAWVSFSELSASLLHSQGVSAGVWSEAEKSAWASSVHTLGDQGLSHLVAGQFLDALEREFKEQHVPSFWRKFEEFPKLKCEAKYSLPATAKLNDWVRATLPRALEEICAAKSSQEGCLTVLAQVFRFDARGSGFGEDKRSTSSLGVGLFSQYQTSVSALLLMSAPKYFADVLNFYFKARFEECSVLVKKHSASGSSRQSGDSDEDEDEDEEAGVESPGNCSGEDIDMDSVPSSGRMSMHIEDMEGNGSPNKHKNGDDDDSAHQMEGIDGLSSSDTKPVVGAAIDELVEIAGELWVKEVGSTVRHLRELGYTSLSEEAYSSAIYSVLKVKIHSIANKRYENPVLLPVQRWIEAVPLRFLCVILASSTFPLGTSSATTISLSTDNILDEVLIRWRSRLQSFAYETLGDLRVSELFDIIVDFPESLAAVEDLKQCLANTGDHAKLVESFRDALQQRLLTAGAATTDILLQYISTIKALRTLDPTGVVLEAVGEPIKEYLRGRKDTIRCIVTMLTDDTGAGGSGALGSVGESLLEELSRGSSTLENVDSEDDGDVDGDEAWAAAERWEPDPVDADPSRTSKSRRLMDVIGMLVGIYGSKELFVNEYRVMLAEKLLNKSDYDTDRNIRTLELLKLRFGENNMHGCEIMLKDVADSKRINTNIKVNKANSEAAPGTPQMQTRASRSLSGQVGTSGGTGTGAEKDDQELSLDVVDATIISSLFWPPFQAETLKVPEVVDRMLDEYAQKYHALKAPRKLHWRKHLGTVKLELQFEDRASQFVVSPLHASIIMQFEGKSSWAASDLAEAVGVSASTLRRRIMLWVNQGVLVESSGARDGESEYTIVENLGDGANRNSGPTVAGDAALPLLGEEEGERAVASMEDQWQQEMNVFESYVVGMLTNFESLPLDRIHNMLKMFVSDPPYDKTLPQLQGFLARLVSEEKLEFQDGSYRRRPI